MIEVVEQNEFGIGGVGRRDRKGSASTDRGSKVLLLGSIRSKTARLFHMDAEPSALFEFRGLEVVLLIVVSMQRTRRRRLWHRVVLWIYELVFHLRGSRTVRIRKQVWFVLLEIVSSVRVGLEGDRATSKGSSLDILWVLRRELLLRSAVVLAAELTTTTKTSHVLVSKRALAPPNSRVAHIVVSPESAGTIALLVIAPRITLILLGIRAVSESSKGGVPAKST